jgi:hypothetical protein
VNAVRGGCYGPEQTPDQIGPGRFSSFTAGIEGLFLVVKTRGSHLNYLLFAGY